MAVDVDHHLVLAARDARTVVEEADAQVFVLVVHLARGRVGDHVALVVERGVAPVGQHVAVRAALRGSPPCRFGSGQPARCRAHG